MSLVSLRPKTFYANASASSNGEWKSVDAAYSGIQQRSIIGNKSANDVIEVQLRITDGAFSVICTATTWVSGVTDFSTVLQGPFHDIRIRKLGENGAANVIGLL